MSKFLYNPTQYTSFRPEYPDELFKILKKTVQNDGLVLDCGSGSGQATQGLSHYFKHVIATDFSFELLKFAKPLPNALFIQSRAEQLPLPSKSIDLITIAQAMHWFCLADFYREVKRVLKQGGIIAAWCYNQSVIKSDIDLVIKDIYTKISSSQNPSLERQYVYENYQTIPFPFKHISVPNFTMEKNWNLMQFLGYLSTWPGLLEYEKKNNIDLILEIQDKLLAVWGNPKHTKLISWPIYLLLGQVA